MKCTDTDQIAQMLYQFNNYYIFYTSFLSFGTRYFKYLIQKKMPVCSVLLTSQNIALHIKERKYSIHSQIHIRVENSSFSLFVL